MTMGCVHWRNSFYVKEAAVFVSRREGWQLYAGWKTEAKGTRQTRRSPTHSRHDAEIQAQKKRLHLMVWALLLRLFALRVSRPGR